MDAKGNMLWSKTFGGEYSDGFTSVQQTDDGGFIVAGWTWSYGQSGDFYLVKTDAAGNRQWSKTFGGSDGETPWAVQQTTDGGYIIAGVTESDGAVDRDVYMVKTDVAGNEQWNKTFSGTSYDEARSVQQTTDGGFIVAGWTSSYGAGGEDAYLLKTDSEGNVGSTSTPVPSLTYMQWSAPPAVTIDPERKYTAIIETEKGNLVLELFAQEAHMTVNNFVFLAYAHLGCKMSYPARQILMLCSWLVKPAKALCQIVWK